MSGGLRMRGGDGSPGAARALGFSARPAVRLAVVYSLIFVIALADALTPSGVVVGLLLSIPILIASLSSQRSDVIAAGVTSLVCFVLAALLGASQPAPQVIRLPNRMLAMTALVAVTWIGLEFQRRRLLLESARASAEAAGDLSRLLHSLLAHDLRAPLILARQSFDMVRGAVAAGSEPSIALIDEVDARLTRSLRTIEMVLEAARADLEEAAVHGVSPLAIAHALQEEIAAFRADARARGKDIVLEVTPPDLVLRLNAPVLRQGVAILVDNAIRYALAGPITIAAQAHGSVLWVHVRDPGPRPDRKRTEDAQSAGIGLRLCRLLVDRSGGSLELARSQPDGTEFIFRLPAAPA